MIRDGKDVYCGACWFWEATGEGTGPFDGAGECRRYAPRPSVFAVDEMDEGMPRVAVLWPLTEFSDACGEFRPRDGSGN